MRLSRPFCIAFGVLCCVTSESSGSPVCEAGKGYVAVDVSEQVDDQFLSNIKSIGIGTVIRYYDWSNETLPGKTLTKNELELVAKHQLNVAVVFQHNNDCLCTFMNPNRGKIDADRALTLASSFSQPPGSAIYFGVDGVDDQYLNLLSQTKLPSSEAQASRFVARYVGEYFSKVSGELRNSPYKIGIYGSGLVCKYLLGEKLVDYCWLANATSWPGYAEMANSKKWVLKQFTPTRRNDCFGVEVDLDADNGVIHQFGQWTPSRN